jgi:hypothetical protein
MSTTNDKEPSAPKTAHPAQEEWMEYLYDESSQESRNRLSEHLRSCDHCREKMAGWSQTHRRLDAWQLPPLQNAGFWSQPLFKWGLAAMLAVGFAFWAGRFSAPAPDMSSIRAEIQKEVMQRVSLVQSRQTQRLTQAIAAASKTEIQRIMADHLKALEASHQEDNRALFAAIQALAAQRAVDYASLREDLETLAVTAQGEIQNTRNNFASLAAYATLPNSQNDTKNQ